MSKDTEQKLDVRTFWNSRAGLGQWAGTRDVIAKQLEIEAISKNVSDGMRILEVGCGNGITAIELASRFCVDILGIDFAADMIDAARTLLHGHTLKGSVRFEVGDVRELRVESGGFDMIYTERVLINLPNWPAQQEALRQMTGLLAPGGLYVMCENSQDGLDALNTLRVRVDLPAIVPPWHNVYFRNALLEQLRLQDVVLENVDDYSSTYYWLSRVINASMAASEKKEPDYESPINQLALRLPSIGNFGQGRIWLWRKVRGAGIRTEGGNVS